MNNSLKNEGGWQETLPVEMARGYLAGKEPTVELMASFAVAYSAQETGPVRGAREPLDRILDEIVLAIAELPDRDSPDDWPEAMLVTEGELKTIIRECMAAAPPSEAVSGKRKHMLRFVDKRGKLAEALGLTNEETLPIERAVEEHLAANKTLRELLECVGEMEIADEVWANFLYTFGYWDGGRQ